jgi:hypothetical protein
MKFREFVKKRRAKTTTSKGAEQSVHQVVEPNHQAKPRDIKTGHPHLTTGSSY